MQNELTALRPQLLETSDETERLMIKIEQDTIQVEAKKEIVACDEALANEAAAAAQAIRYGFYWKLGLTLNDAGFLVSQGCEGCPKVTARK